MLNEDCLLTPADLAQRLGKPISFVKYLRIHGTGPPVVYLGPRSLRYRLSDVVAWEASLLASTGAR